MKKVIFFLIILLCANTAHAEYSRIVSLAPSITSELYDLGVEDKLIGVTSHCKAPGKDVVGTLLDINLEKIISLKPDLILATNEWNSDNSISKLKQLGLNVIVFGRQDNFQKVCEDFVKLGEIIGKKPAAEKMAQDIVKQANDILSKSKNTVTKKVLWQVNAKPLITIGKSALASDLLRFAGYGNLFLDINRPYSRVSYEEAVKRDPDVIILAGMGNVMQEEKEYWFKFKNVTAVKQNRIFILDPYKSCQPTPVKFLQALKEIVGLINYE
ncbi:MAG: hypothetical protein COW11_06200 [Candidatus Omnitrophica bacterium CG12_big_fil_rev_8_21_14_0_65_43_15]|uniref:Fe/B12 periplasmic-binding domain-containing protein n=1 Tax=Candidatus Taenaricola geysiri TaxID=1974752 RepID=A0A2J0LDF7_9BACT|nr:MAG: hypothetical protein AUJ89_02290 [Candidatus Omnitrophica bacterium CG1_02_43_210]PIR65610.1 MAG: hypothetical protein COU52_03275 [Candidatus Omnitrophica bacterium CG10_big_fil_rev_8_21_14_0_10_43_8]PIV11656.1 MAG: hypothetical protein COS48_04990 [Candidatus Omnitrophica bacterium CG03_land_8_20_14_0_80_43_22]PIW65898.1 MAG: hypothetical protein COW11_06200 [Candidatus Omnitrophica bacterium CG12_big_fil_rev_8_21_14_0_65_43_15]PIW80094.1 MAG: hypothetical protein COZ98_04180 [Candida